MAFVDYTELDVFKECRILVTNIYTISKEFQNEEIYGLTNQIRRASISILSNLAEGVGRNSVKDSLQFFYISRGSLYEVEAQLLIACDLGYISENQLNEILLQSTNCKKLLNGFINYHKSKL